jgi:hypothetical protein
MKRVLSLVLVVGLLATVAAMAADVSSVNVVGVSQLTVPAGGYVLVGCNFDTVGDAGAGIPIQDLFGDGDLTGGSSSGSGDNLILWDDAAQQYIRYFKFYYGGQPTYDNYWMKVGEVVAGGTTDVVHNAQGFYVQNVHGDEQSFSVSGEVLDLGVGGTNTLTVGEGYSMLGSPYAAEVAINDSGLGADAKGGSNSGSADNIIKWDKTAQAYVRYFYFYYGGQPTFDNLWMKVGEVVAGGTTDTIALGEGFLYERRAGEGDMSWSEIQQYDLDL